MNMYSRGSPDMSVNMSGVNDNKCYGVESMVSISYHIKSGVTSQKNNVVNITSFGVLQ